MGTVGTGMRLDGSNPQGNEWSSATGGTWLASIPRRAHTPVMAELIPGAGVLDAPAGMVADLAGLPAAILACAVVAVACALIPSPASSRSVRAVAALLVLIALTWMVAGYLLGPRGDASTASVILVIGCLGLVVTRRWSDRQVRAWVGALGLALLLAGGGDLVLIRSQESGFDLTLTSAAIAAVGSVVLVAGQVSGIKALTAVAIIGWLAWIPGLAQATGDRGQALLGMLALMSLGLLVSALVRPDPRMAVSAVVSASLVWLLAVGSGQAWWPARQAPIEAYTLGTLAGTVLLVGVLVRLGSMAHWQARRVIAAGTIAVAVSSLAALAWSLNQGSLAELAR